jgi:hypothetical protein
MLVEAFLPMEGPFQNPSSVSSNLTEGTHTGEALEQVDGVFMFAE